ncbi:peptide/nickel transport system substrate-binding protein [Catenuloplanes nepalensis]|uniref:Peptide/nickel transport system substrate-binding protein n=1 Tax=Catenuloplanes nepalensis TaxID=587533 RepID=A0ABT9MMX5_9ACTN|nr:ABC transporter substrate-binding protein [Catenuloplanes nepalensis]MDP9792787.1 peptide/nickel transport system substrate-binding protein [Catenuloplanes nepalensis]
MKRAWTAVAAASALLLSACGGGGDDTPVDSAGATINIGSVYEPQNLDNTAGGGQGVTEALNGNVYEGLFKLTDAGTVEPLLATAHTASEDGLTYTFTLADGVTFHSGKALTSADVKASIERVTAETSKSARKSSLAVVKEIATPDDRTVTVTLSAPSISFVYNLSYVWIVNTAAGDLTTTADGTGPYKLGEWKRGATLSLTRNDAYWGTKAKNAGAVFHYFTDATALNNALLTNAIDVVTSEQSPDALAQFENNPAYKINEGTSTTKLLLAFNDRVAPFDKVQVRKAVSAAIDNAKLLNSIWGEYGALIGSMVPPGDPWYEDLTAVNAYDVEAAKRLLAEGGQPNGFTFTLDTPNYDPHPTAATFIKSELAKIGVTVEINTITSDEWYTKVYQERDFQATMQEHVNDRDVVWYGNPDFYWGYSNATVTDLVKQAEAAKTEAAQSDLLKQANKIIAEEAASDWLYLYPQIVVASSALSGYPLNGRNSQFFVYDIVKS